MVNTLKENNGGNENPVEDKPLETQPKHRCQRRRSKPHSSKNSNTVTGENNTPENAENNEDPVELTSEQEEREDGRVSPGEQAMNKDLEDSNYLPLSEDEMSLSDKDFIMPEEPAKQESFKR